MHRPSASDLPGNTNAHAPYPEKDKMGVALARGRLDVGGHTVYELLRNHHRDFFPSTPCRYKQNDFAAVMIGMIRDSFVGIAGLLELSPHGLQAGAPVSGSHSNRCDRLWCVVHRSLVWSTVQPGRDSAATASRTAPSNETQRSMKRPIPSSRQDRAAPQRAASAEIHPT